MRDVGHAIHLFEVVNVEQKDLRFDGQPNGSIGLAWPVEDDFMGGRTQVQRQAQLVLGDNLGACAKRHQAADHQGSGCVLNE
jgi:hypothetical protein